MEERKLFTGVDFLFICYHFLLIFWEAQVPSRLLKHNSWYWYYMKIKPKHFMIQLFKIPWSGWLFYWHFEYIFDFFLDNVTLYVLWFEPLTIHRYFLSYLYGSNIYIKYSCINLSFLCAGSSRMIMRLRYILFIHLLFSFRRFSCR